MVEEDIKVFRSKWGDRVSKRDRRPKWDSEPLVRAGAEPSTSEAGSSTNTQLDRDRWWIWELVRSLCERPALIYLSHPDDPPPGSKPNFPLRLLRPSATSPSLGLGIHHQGRGGLRKPIGLTRPSGTSPSLRAQNPSIYLIDWSNLVVMQRAHISLARWSMFPKLSNALVIYCVSTA